MIELKMYQLNRLDSGVCVAGVGVCLTEPSLISCQRQLLVLSGKPPRGVAAALHRSQL